MATRASVAILGGGVIGLTTAYLLAREGVASIVLDQGEIGKEASWAGAGIIPACDIAHARTPLERLRALSVARFPEFSEELRQRTGVDNGYFVCGGFEFAADDSAVADDEWCGPGTTIETLTEAESRRLEPALNHGLGNVRRHVAMAQLRNPRHLQALAAACVGLRESDGWPLVELRPGVAVTSIFREGNRVEAVGTTHGIVEADRFLLAAGAWTGRLLRQVGLSAPIEPIRGQIVLLDPGPPLIRHILAAGPRYLVPRPEGRILVGSTEEHAGFLKQTTAGAIQALLELATRLVPDLAAARVERSWAGLRPGTRDRQPYLGRVADFDNLFIAAGHFRSGLHLSIGTAEAMVDLMQGRPPAVDLAPFAIERRQGNNDA